MSYLPIPCAGSSSSSTKVGKSLRQPTSAARQALGRVSQVSSPKTGFGPARKGPNMLIIKIQGWGPHPGVQQIACMTRKLENGENDNRDTEKKRRSSTVTSGNER